MRIPRGIFALGLFCLLSGGCADTAIENREVYVVRPHDTLYSIAWRYDIDYRDLARWNNIGPDFRIAVGQSLVLAGKARPARAPPSQASSTRLIPHAAAREPNASSQKWEWPTDRLSPPRPVQGGGILLSGQPGQDIRAACAGRVVYTGSGIRGYGNLIIIKHSDNLLSAYAHNRDSLVRDGEEVALGQVIAHMGEGAPRTPVLYFEIRRNGLPINPEGMLPQIK